MPESMALPQPGSVLMSTKPVTIRGHVDEVWALTWGHVGTGGPPFCWDDAYLSGLCCHPGPWWHPDASEDHV